MQINLTLVDNVVLGGIDGADAPDFCDAFIEAADYDGVPMTDKQLDALNEDSDFVHCEVMKQLY